MKPSITTLLLGFAIAIAIWYVLKPSAEIQEPIHTGIPVIVKENQGFTKQTEASQAKSTQNSSKLVNSISKNLESVKPNSIQAASFEPNLITATALTSKKAMEPFALTDTESREFNQSHFNGQWTLLFFGYANCPDICPKSLAIVSDLFKKMPNRPKLVFVTLNPEQDNVNNLKQFLSRFNKDFLGLTGDQSEISKLAKYCRVYHVTEEKLNAMGQKMIDHSGAFFLINPKGQLHALFSPPHDSNLIAKDLEFLMK